MQQWPALGSMQTLCTSILMSWPHNTSQGEKGHTGQGTDGGGAGGRQDGKLGWHEDKGRAAESRWDKPGGGGMPDRSKPFSPPDALIRGGMAPGGAPAVSKWREDGDRVLPRREPANRCYPWSCHSPSKHTKMHAL